ncbi:MAG: hypothetical protein QN168_03155 [Armatimonadota bacterium]|nr:hypothetical protein [Armatimonadota bacterium]
MQRLVIWAMVAGAILGLTGQAAASHTGLLFGASSRVTIAMREWAFAPAVVTVESGTAVDLVLENTGSVSHVFMVYPKPQAPPKGVGAWYDYVLARTYLQDMGEILVHRRGDLVVTGTRIAEVGVEPGKRVTLTFTPTRRGTFEIGCHLATGGGGSHYQAGMKGTLVVK